LLETAHNRRADEVSGPPLPVLMHSLEVLRDLRLAADRRDIATRHDDLGKLRSVVKADSGVALTGGPA
jgi:hypothetical protein